MEESILDDENAVYNIKEREEYVLVSRAEEKAKQEFVKSTYDNLKKVMEDIKTIKSVQLHLMDRLTLSNKWIKNIEKGLTKNEIKLESLELQVRFLNLKRN